MHKIKIVSPNFDLKYNLSNYDIENLIKELIKYSEPDKSKETLFIWPEGVFTGFELNDIVQYKKLFESAFSTKHVIIFGANIPAVPFPQATTTFSLFFILFLIRLLI